MSEKKRFTIANAGHSRRSRKNRMGSRRRVLRLESLESRELLAADALAGMVVPANDSAGATHEVVACRSPACCDGTRSPWQNPVNSEDVNRDGVVTAVDALLVINDLNQNKARELPQDNSPRGSQAYIDVNGDGFVSPNDALAVINSISRSEKIGTAEGDASHNFSLTAPDEAIVGPRRPALAEGEGSPGMPEVNGGPAETEPEVDAEPNPSHTQLATIPDDAIVGPRRPTPQDNNQNPAETEPELVIPSVIEVGEPSGFVEVPVKLVTASHEVVTVRYTTVCLGTASYGRDYIPASGTLTFQPGVVEQTVRIEIVDDVMIEAEEEFPVQFTLVAGDAEQKPLRTSIKILRDDEFVGPLRPSMFAQAADTYYDELGRQ